eukprot:Colp12_sorted_trinity150504_noHs@21808
MALPLAKLAYLGIKQLAKPIAANIKKQAIEHEKFKRLCIGFAQMYNRFDTTIKIRLLGHVPVDIKPLSEAKAVQVGSEVLGEVVIFSIAASVLLAEYARSSVKERAKEQKLRDTLDEYASGIAELRHAVSEGLTRQESLERELTQMRGLLEAAQAAQAAQAVVSTSPQEQPKTPGTLSSIYNLLFTWK